MTTLSRKLDPERRRRLKECPLFKSCLSKDIFLSEKGSSPQVFPAIRNNNVDFYYKGGRLFQFDGKKFITHKKYASVIENRSLSNNIDEAKLKNQKLISSFEKGYEGVKENCKNYSGVEAIGVSQLYSSGSYLIPSLNIVVLDIEVQFSGKHSRIDLLLFNKTNRTLRFYEAKHFTNPELWAKKDVSPKVIEQIGKYSGIISDTQTILDAYNSYTEIVNDLFGINLPYPEKLDEKVALLWFGFDRNQMNKAQDLLFGDGSLVDTPHYAIGNIKQCNVEKLWNGTK